MAFGSLETPALHRGARIAALGECMIELRDRPGGCSLGFGGDTLNTALYLARMGARVEYVTVLGDDPYSEAMLEAWHGEGIGTAYVRRDAGRLPGLYAIRTDETGERRFYYWRDRAPARGLFLPPHGEELAQALGGFDLIYLSGITLSILDAPQRERLIAALEKARAHGALVAFDPNYRPAGWRTPSEASFWFESLYGQTNVALPTLDDERHLHPQADARSLAERLRALGVAEVVIKEGADGCTVVTDAGLQRVPTQVGVACVDTTAAGDSFNAAYLSGRLAGLPPETAALLGHRLAGVVIGHPGAIIPRQAMPADLHLAWSQA